MLNFLDYLENSRPLSGAKIVRLKRAGDLPTKRCVKGSDVTLRKVDNVDEVPHCRAVMSVPVRAKDVENRLLPSEDLCEDWKEVGGFLAGILSEQAGVMTSNWIEVSQGNDVP